MRSSRSAHPAVDKNCKKTVICACRDQNFVLLYSGEKQRVFGACMGKIPKNLYFIKNYCINYCKIIGGTTVCARQKLSVQWDHLRKRVIL